MTEHKKCAGQVSVPGMRLVYKSCDKRGSLEHKGKWWCKIHHPPTVAARRDARHAAFYAERQEEWAAEKKKAEAEKKKAEQAQRDAADLATFRALAKRAVARLKVLRECNMVPADLEIELAKLAEERKP